MKASELIEKLQDLVDKHGDHACYISGKRVQRDYYCDYVLSNPEFSTNVTHPKCLSATTSGFRVETSNESE